MQDSDQKLNESLKDLYLSHEIVQNLNEVFWLRDLKEEKILYINPAYEKVYGRSCESLYANPSSFMDAVHPSDQKLVQETYKDYLKTGIFQIEYRILMPNGAVKWVQTRNIPIKNETGEIVRDAGLVIDVTHMKSSELDQEQLSKLQEILMNTAKKYINISLDKIDTYINRSLEEIGQFVQADRAYVFEYDWSKKVTNNTYEWCKVDIEPQIEDLQGVPIDFISDWVNAHQLGNSMYIEDVFQLKENSPIREILEPQDIKSLIAVPMMRGKQCIGFVGFDSVKSHHKYTLKEQSLLEVFAQIMVNIGIRKELEDSLIVQKERAEIASQAKSDFLANMSHELRTPLNGVLGFADILAQTELSKTQNRYLEVISKSALSLLDIINDILDFSKIETGKFNLEFAHINLPELIEQSFEMIQFPASQKNLRTHIKLADGLPKITKTDPIRLRQLIVNLLSNAVKFTEHGEIELNVKIEESELDRKKIRFSVKDTGIGMTDQLIQRLYSAFDQGDNSATRKFGGVGLGLTISDHIVKKFGSSLEVESNIGIGSTFSFCFWFEDYSNSLPIDSLKQVLIIDDSDEITEMLQPHLIRYSIKSETVKNGLEAMKALGDHPNFFNWVIVKSALPFLNGIESIQMILKKLPMQVKTLPFSLVNDPSLPTTTNKVGDVALAPALSLPISGNDFDNIIQDVSQRVVSKNSTEKKNKLSEIKLEKPSKPIIMVVEDNESNRYLVETLLKTLIPGLKILVAKHGREALEMLETNVPNLIIMDVQMPIMDGIEATIAIRALASPEKNQIPIIGLTAGVQAKEKQNCLDAGMDAFMTKPIGIANFKSVLQTYLTLI